MVKAIDLLTVLETILYLTVIPRVGALDIRWLSWLQSSHIQQARVE